MKVKNISNPEEFLKVIDSCEGRVELITLNQHLESVQMAIVTS